MGRVASFKWLELRPLGSGIFPPSNLLDALGVLYNSGRPFRFIIASCPSPTVENQRVVRFFFQAEEGIIDRVKGLFRTGLNVQVVEGSKPPDERYEVCADLELKGHYALPICDFSGKKTNPVDGMVLALAKGVGTVDVTAVEDSSARRGILSWIAQKTRRSASFTDILLDSILGIFDAILGGPPPSRQAKTDLSPVLKARVGMASEKAAKKLFRCTIKVMGDRSVVDALADVLPSSATNRFVKRRVQAGGSITETLQKPPKHIVRNLINKAFWLPSAVFLSAAFIYGKFDPLRLANIDITIMAAAVAAAAAVKIAIPARRPVVLSDEELSLIVSLPTEIGRLPVELGTSPITREQLIPVVGEKQPEEAGQRVESGPSEPKPLGWRPQASVKNAEPPALEKLSISPLRSLREP